MELDELDVLVWMVGNYFGGGTDGFIYCGMSERGLVF